MLYPLSYSTPKERWWDSNPRPSVPMYSNRAVGRLAKAEATKLRPEQLLYH
jgi:hypothetical protein